MPTMSDHQTLAERVVEETAQIDSFAYWGDLPLGKTWGFTFAHTRDSDSMERWNYGVVLAALEEKFPDDCEEVHCSHWACGWITHLAVRMLDDDGKVTAAGELVLDFRAEVEDYPLLDEMGYSEKFTNCTRCEEDFDIEEEGAECDDTHPDYEDLYVEQGPYCKWCWEDMTRQRDSLRDDEAWILSSEGVCPDCGERTYILLRVPPLNTDDHWTDYVETWCGHMVKASDWLCENGLDMDAWAEEFGDYDA